MVIYCSKCYMEVIDVCDEHGVKYLKKADDLTGDD